jgi:nonsense-mediated mRNA decay protein 3
MLICPKCGKQGAEVKFLEAFCIDCYPFNVKLPKEQTLDVCKKCGRMRLLSAWQPYNKKKIAELIVQKLRGEFSSAEYDVDNGIVTATITKHGKSVNIERKFGLHVLHDTCPDCSKMTGGYFEAIIQLRGREEKIEKYRKIFEKELTKKTFIGKTKEQHGGIDLYVGKSRVVLELVAELGLNAKITRKLFGRRNGKRIYRTTFSVRFE